MTEARKNYVVGAVWKWLAGLLGLASLTVAAHDWPRFHGPNQDSVSTDRITRQWTGSVTNPVWSVLLTNGITSLAVSGGRVFTQVARDVDGDGYVETEFCLALNATNGSVIWSTEVESHLPDLYDSGVGTDDGPRSTPTVDGGSVYVLSSYLKLHRLNATNGAVIWSTNLVAGLGGAVIGWQNAASPVVDNGLIFVNANGGSQKILALRTSNGTLAWRSQNEGMTHSTPVLATIHGVRQLIFATQSGLVSLAPLTGTLLWKSPYPFGYSTSLAASPVVHGDYVFITANYSMSAYAVQIALSNSVQIPQPRWTNTVQRSHWSTPVAYAGHLFGMFYPDNSDGQLRCVDLATGVTRWATNGFGRSGLVLVGTNLVCITERGALVLAAANTNAYTQLGRFQAIRNYHSDTNKCWNAPAIADGRVYVRSTAYAAAFDLSVPDLKLDPPQVGPGGQFQLVVRTANGTPVNTNRLATLEVRATTNSALPLTSWTKLTNALVLAGGVVQLTNVDATLPRRFFVVSEPK